MRILVTGGAGFIGANLCKELAKRREIDSIAILDDLSTGSLENLEGLDVEFVLGSILDRDLVDKIAYRADAVVHLGARPSVPRSIADPVATHEVNATGTLYVLDACRRSGAHVVAASSSSVYGDAAVLPAHENLPTRPLSPYAASKLAAEGYLSGYAASFGLPILAFRFFNVYGPLQAPNHDYAAVIPKFLYSALHGEPVRVYGDGRQTRDFTYVGSVVRVLADAVTRRVVSRTPVNLAFGTSSSLLDLIGEMRRTLELEVVAEHLPARPGEVRDSRACDRRLAELFPGVLPTPLSEGLEVTGAWMNNKRGRP
ncbi:NAD-dependent epimerase/dehydratase family protein [Nonomuraea sp. NBC_01738]|uniref:NAD-dependent epimerase/dehydratase family protein n=1 Tax=Nonomuraea sp. NBC_01738 TaxID=2976003 RepID=UPI002E0D3813|nr:NAD-dependent epimerase/dehydratase family protein [Nonomuraea sp. NBC_01738]